MLTTVKRNLQLYFSNEASVFFSLMGAWIAFVLYIIFLQKNMLDAWSSLSHPEKFLDRWVMGGILAVTGITTTWSGTERLVRDKESQKFSDFLLTDTTNFQLNVGYLISAGVIGSVMQVVMYTIMSLYFYYQDGLRFEVSNFPSILGVIVLSSVMSALLALLLVQFVKTVEVAERLSTIIGTASGFLVGVYMPIGTLPDVAQKIIKLVPGAYVASVFRQILVGDDIPKWKSSLDIKEYLGIEFKWGDHLLTCQQNILIIAAVIVVSLLVLFSFLWVEGQGKTCLGKLAVKS
ncbi:ABC transporter permease [Streptococcus sp. FT1-106]|uniref:ABC transporter permease n=1 Tax=Streptococcus sp. FT1-106 TaxID=3409994 RepID=UPI003BF49E3A